MKARLHILAAVLLLFVPMTLSAQNHVRRAMERARERQEAMARMKVDSEKGKGGGSGKMRVLVENGDTTFLDRVPAVYIVGRGRRSDEKSWKDYYRLVWRFARVYPYAQASGKLVKQVDSTLNAEHYGFIRKERYISAIQKQLFKDFEGSFREMSIQQGAVLLKLIDRETGITSYELIKNYKSGFAAGFWQGVAKLFDNDLKSRYDPTGADRELEELVQIWQRGEFPSLYWSVFWEDPPTVVIPETYL
ncbi:MAG: DUF4294 domain-containing protein [Bacteroidales bacterium]|nr:DUF4294 domain-containing protein [Bacteroidales bacterium]